MLKYLEKCGLIQTCDYLNQNYYNVMKTSNSVLWALLHEHTETAASATCSHIIFYPIFHWPHTEFINVKTAYFKKLLISANENLFLLESSNISLHFHSKFKIEY